MRRCYLAYLGFITGFVGLIFLPIGFKIFAFFFPAILICMSLNREKYNFNLLLFLVILFPFVFIPSQMFTSLDASQPFDVRQMTLGINSGIAMVVVLVYYGVPTFMIAGSIYAIAIGQIDSASKVVIKLIPLMGVLLLILYGFTIIGVDPTNGVLTGIGDFYISLIIAVFEFPSAIYNLIRAGINAINSIIKGVEKALETFADPTGVLGVDFHFATLPQLPRMPSYNIRRGLTMDASWQELNAMNYNTHIYAVNDILPIIITGTCLITGLFMTKKTWEKQIVNKIDALFGEEKIHKRKEYFPDVDLSMYVYLAIILFGGWYLLLSYGRSYGVDPLSDWRMILYIFYTIIIVVSVFLLTTKDLFYYERSTVKNTVKGTLLGVVILKLITFMFTPQVLDAYSNIDLENDLTYIGLTFIFIAPAESLFFFVFFPGLVFGVLLSSSKKKRKILYEADRKLILAVIDIEIKTLTKQAEIAKVQKNTKLFNWLKASIDYLQKRRMRKELREPVILMQKKMVFGRRNPLILFIVFGCFLPAFLFAIIHYPMLALTGMPFATFFNCGLFTIYFCCGVFFILLNISCGWQSSVWSHAIFNTLTIWMCIIMLGV